MAPSATAIASPVTVPVIFAVLVISTLPSGSDIAFNVASDNDVVGKDRAKPVAAPRQLDGATNLAVARDLAIYLKVAVAGDFAADFAAFVYKGRFTRRLVAHTSKSGFAHAASAPPKGKCCSPANTTLFRFLLMVTVANSLNFDEDASFER